MGIILYFNSNIRNQSFDRINNNKTYIKEGKINEQNINKTRTYKYILVFSNDCTRLFSRNDSMLN